MGSKISVGLGSWLGIIGAAAGVLIPLIGDLADASAPLGVPGGVWVIAGSILATAVVLGRMAQAVANTISPPPDGIDLLAEPVLDVDSDHDMPDPDDIVAG